MCVCVCKLILPAKQTLPVGGCKLYIEWVLHLYIIFLNFYLRASQRKTLGYSLLAFYVDDVSILNQVCAFLKYLIIF